MLKKIIFLFLLLPLVSAVGVSPTKLDFGDVKRGEVKEFSFTVFNDLDKEMEYSFSGDHINLPGGLILGGLSSMKINSSLKLPKEFYENNFSGIILIKERNENEKINLINSVGIKYFFNVLNPLKEIKEVKGKEEIFNKTEYGVLEFVNISNVGLKKPAKIRGAFYNYGGEDLNCNLECEIYFNEEIIDFVKSSSVNVLGDEGIFLEVYFTPLKHGEYLSKCRVNYGEYTPFVEKEFYVEKPNSITGAFFLTPERSVFSGLFIFVVVLGLFFAVRYFILRK